MLRYRTQCNVLRFSFHNDRLGGVTWVRLHVSIAASMNVSLVHSCVSWSKATRYILACTTEYIHVLNYGTYASPCFCSTPTLSPFNEEGQRC